MEICLQVSKHQFLNFITQLNKQGNEIISINNNFDNVALVWLVNSPLLQTQLLPTPNGMSCGGYDVTVMQDKPKGALFKMLHNVSYFDLMRFVNRMQPKATSWSPPTCTNAIKHVFR